MKIKGVAVKSIYKYVEKQHPKKLNDWLKALPEASRKIFTQPVDANTFYDIDSAGIIPTQIAGKLFFNNELDAAWDMGRFSAQDALGGVYKVFIMVATPKFLLSKAGTIMSRYYENSAIHLEKVESGKAILHLTRFDQPSSIIEYRIAGWMQAALEKTNCKNVKVALPESIANGNSKTVFEVSWDSQ